MKKKILISSIIGAVFTGAAGTLLHFLFEWCGELPAVGLFSAVNESTWEHLKLFFIPYFIFTFIEYFIYGRHLGNFFSVKLLGALTAMSLIVGIFYTYTGVIGKNIAWLNIAIFFVSEIFAYILSYIMLTEVPFETTPLFENISIFLLFLILALFFVFTFLTPKIGLFQDPTDMTYGIKKVK